MVLGKFLEEIISEIKLERPSHSYYQISFESNERVTTKRLLKEEFESDELLLMILSYLGENKLIDKTVTEDLPWLLDYLIDFKYARNISMDNPLIFVELTYNSGRVELPNPIDKFFDGSKESCIDYITNLYENN